MTSLPESATVSVIGAGTMGAGIAQVAAAHGHRVLLFDADETAVAKGLAGIGRFLDRSVEKGRLDAPGKASILGRIEPVAALAGLAPSNLAIEAIVERLDVKQAVFAELESIVPDDCILASNTSSLSVTAMGAALKRPDRLVGMHFFNPAPLMRLVEIVTGLATSEEACTTAFDTAAAWGKTPVIAKSTPGFIANRINRPFYGESLRLLEEGAADAATIDAIMRDCGGFRMGPFQLMDLVGNDVNLAVTRSIWEAFHYDPRYCPSLMQEELVAAGRYGRKTGQGWFRYGEGVENPAPVAAPRGPKPKRVRVTGVSAWSKAGPASLEALAVLAYLAHKAGIEVDADWSESDFAPPGWYGKEPAGHYFRPAGRRDSPPAAEESGGQAVLAPMPDVNEENWGPEPDESDDPFDADFSDAGIYLNDVVLRPAIIRNSARFDEDDMWEDDDHPTVWFDLCLDYSASPRIVIGATNDTPRGAILAAAGFFQALGKEVTVVDDVPGLVLARIVAMIANEAAEAVYAGVCNSDGADAAMLYGLNYPVGPLAWALSIGHAAVVNLLDDLFDAYKDPRYRPSRGFVRLAQELRERSTL